MDHKKNNKVKKYTPKGLQKVDKTKMLSGAVLVLALTSSVLAYKLYNVNNSNNVEIMECSGNCIDEGKSIKAEDGKTDKDIRSKTERMHKKIAPNQNRTSNAFEELYDEMEENFSTMSGSFERFADRFEDEFVEPFETVHEKNKFLRRNFSKEETSDIIIYNVRLNDINKDMIDLSIRNGSLSINVEKKKDSEVDDDEFYSRRSSFKSYHKEFLLPDNIDTKSANAVIEDDTLRISFKKKVKDKKIKIK